MTTAATAKQLETFPIPESGRTQIKKTGELAFVVECTGISAEDAQMLVAFYCAMQGAGPFRFAHGNSVYAECFFASNEGPPLTQGLRYNDVSFPVLVQPA